MSSDIIGNSRYTTWFQKGQDILTYLSICRELKQMYTLPADQAKEIQEERFLRLVRHAYATIPFYRQRWDRHGIGPGDIHSLADIVKLPLVSKEELREGVKAGLFPETVANPRCIMFNTTGSTGTPLTIGWSREFSIRLSTYFSPAMVSFGSGIPVKREIFILILGRGDTIPVVSHDDPHMVPPGLTYTRGNISFIDALEPPERILAFINEKKPDFIGGYGGTFASLALYARQHNLPVHRPRLMGFSGEGLPPQSVRIIGDVFQAPVMTSYVSTETGMIGVERRYGEGYKVFFWNEVVEILNEDGTPVQGGETGSVVVTTFQNAVTPLIRYSGLCDLACFSDEPQDYGLVIKSIHGRRMQSLVRHDMSCIEPYLIDIIMDETRGIGQYQVVQHSLDEVEIFIVPDSFPSDFMETPDHDSLVCRFRDLIGPGALIRVSQVSAIPQKTGVYKTPLIITHVRDQLPVS